MKVANDLVNIYIEVNKLILSCHQIYTVNQRIMQDNYILCDTFFILISRRI